jgi:starvation-inducible DNA-binding protein
MKFNKELVQKKLMEKRTLTEAPEDAALVTQLNKILADAFLFYFKTATFHWNIEGKDFVQYHEFLGDTYAQVYGSIDRLAEEIRMLGSYAPISLMQLVHTSNLRESTSKLDSPVAMFSVMAADNENIIIGLRAGQRSAEAAGEVGLANYLQDLVDSHKKLAWMLTSILKG